MDTGADWILIRVLCSVSHVFNDSNVLEHMHRLFTQDATSVRDHLGLFLFWVVFCHVSLLRFSLFDSFSHLLFISFISLVGV